MSSTAAQQQARSAEEEDEEEEQGEKFEFEDSDDEEQWSSVAVTPSSEAPSATMKADTDTVKHDTPSTAVEETPLSQPDKCSAEKLTQETTTATSDAQESAKADTCSPQKTGKPLPLCVSVCVHVHVQYMYEHVFCAGPRAPHVSAAQQHWINLL